MDTRVHELQQIALLEDELRLAIRDREAKMRFTRTEQYFCPIKHARKVLGANEHYGRFLEYGDSTDFHARLEAFRKGSAQLDGGAPKDITKPV